MEMNHKQDIQRERPEGITCSHYEAIPGRKHCRHYLVNGACSRPDVLTCSEWLKVNGQYLATTSVFTYLDPDERRRISESSPLDMFGNPNPNYKPGAEFKVPTDLFGDPIYEPKKRRHKTPSQQRPTAARRSLPPPKPIEKPEPLRGFTPEDIDSFKELNIEVRLKSEEFGGLWLVPRYTDQDRLELTPEHAATIYRVLQAFPDAKVAAFKKTSIQNKESNK